MQQTRGHPWFFLFVVFAIVALAVSYTPSACQANSQNADSNLVVLLSPDAAANQGGGSFVMLVWTVESSDLAGSNPQLIVAICEVSPEARAHSASAFMGTEIIASLTVQPTYPECCYVNQVPTQVIGGNEAMISPSYSRDDTNVVKLNAECGYVMKYPTAANSNTATVGDSKNMPAIIC